MFKFSPSSEVCLNPDKINAYFLSAKYRNISIFLLISVYFFPESPAIDACATWLWLRKRGPENEANMPRRARMPILLTVHCVQHVREAFIGITGWDVRFRRKFSSFRLYLSGRNNINSAKWLFKKKREKGGYSDCRFQTYFYTACLLIKKTPFSSQQ